MVLPRLGYISSEFRAWFRNPKQCNELWSTRQGDYVQNHTMATNKPSNVSQSILQNLIDKCVQKQVGGKYHTRSSQTIGVHRLYEVGPTWKCAGGWGIPAKMSSGKQSTELEIPIDLIVDGRSHRCNSNEAVATDPVEGMTRAHPRFPC